MAKFNVSEDEFFKKHFNRIRLSFNSKGRVMNYKEKNKDN
jgi:hypothetical protein